MKKTLVISGATRGIGKAIAERFAREGIDIAFTYNSNQEVAENLAKEWSEKYNIKAKAYKLNILEPETIKSFSHKLMKILKEWTFSYQMQL